MRNWNTTATVDNAAGKERPAMSRPEIAKISAEDLQRRRISVDAHRLILLRKLQDAAGIDEVTDIFPALWSTLHSGGKRTTDERDQSGL